MSSAFLVVNSDFVIVSSTKLLVIFLIVAQLLLIRRSFDLLVIPDFKENVTSSH